MDKTSTPYYSTPAIQSVRRERLQPRHSTIARLRQLARATFPTPLGSVLVIN